MAKLNINGRIRDVEVEADTPLLWCPEQVVLTGTKYGCGVARAGVLGAHHRRGHAPAPLRSARGSYRSHRHHRGALAVELAPRPGGVGGARCPQWLLPIGTDHGAPSAAAQKTNTTETHRRVDVQHCADADLSAHSCRRAHGGGMRVAGARHADSAESRVARRPL